MERKATEPGAPVRGPGREPRTRWTVWAAVAAGTLCPAAPRALAGPGAGAEPVGHAAMSVGLMAGALALVYGVSWLVRRTWGANGGEGRGGNRVPRRGRSEERGNPAGGTSASPEVPKPAARSGGVPGRVLVVDDMAMNRTALGALLERAGVREVRQAGNGAEAMDEMRDWIPDAVFTDMWMPIMDGQELAEAMRKDARLAGVPVVAVTADDEAGETYSLKAFAAVMVKPVTGAKLEGAFGAAGRAR